VFSIFPSKLFEKSLKSFSTDTCTPPFEEKEVFGHLRGGVRVWVKNRSRTVAKSTSGISPGITPNLIQTRKTEIFWGIIRFPPC
jgi:hypothetical protein